MSTSHCAKPRRSTAKNKPEPGPGTDQKVDSLPQQKTLPRQRGADLGEATAVTTSKSHGGITWEVHMFVAEVAPVLVCPCAPFVRFVLVLVCVLCHCVVIPLLASACSIVTCRNALRSLPCPASGGNKRRCSYSECSAGCVFLVGFLAWMSMFGLLAFWCWGLSSAFPSLFWWRVGSLLASGCGFCSWVAVFLRFLVLAGFWRVVFLVLLFLASFALTDDPRIHRELMPSRSAYPGNALVWMPDPCLVFCLRLQYTGSDPLRSGNRKSLGL